MILMNNVLHIHTVDTNSYMVSFSCSPAMTLNILSGELMPKCLYDQILWAIKM